MLAHHIADMAAVRWAELAEPTRAVCWRVQNGGLLDVVTSIGLLNGLIDNSLHRTSDDIELLVRNESGVRARRLSHLRSLAFSQEKSKFGLRSNVLM